MSCGSFLANFPLNTVILLFQLTAVIVQAHKVVKRVAQVFIQRIVAYTGCIFTNNVVALYYIFISKPTEKEVGLQPKIDEHRLPIFR